MSFRTVVIKNRCKLEYSLNYLICRSDKETKIHISEITTLIIQSTQVSITTALLVKLINAKVKIIFCDEFSNPQSELVPYYGSYNVREKLIAQLNISKDWSDEVWAEIIKRKIKNQANNLLYLNHNDSESKLLDYCNSVELGDITNREGHAAKVYFNSMFGKDFSRSSDCVINAYLNYGYSILLSAINREIKAMGYLTEIGIHHIGDTNPFNLSCDFIEPLRPLVDFYVIANKVDESNFKKVFIDMININVNIDGKVMILDNALRIYIRSLFSSLLSLKNEIKFIEYECV